jgi:hypothetical protein
MGDETDHEEAGTGGPERLGGLSRIHVLGDLVDDHDVGVVAGDQQHGLDHGLGLADDLDAGPRRQAPDQPSGVRIVVDHDRGQGAVQIRGLGHHGPNSRGRAEG